MTVTVASSAIANPEVLKEKCKHSASLTTNVVFLVDQGAGNVFTSAPGGFLLVLLSL